MHLRSIKGYFEFDSAVASCIAVGLGYTCLQDFLAGKWGCSRMRFGKISEVWLDRKAASRQIIVDLAS